MTDRFTIIGCFLEWQRVLRPDGVVFMIFPTCDALPADLTRPVTDTATIAAALLMGLTVETTPEPEGQGKGGHYYVYTLQSMKALIERAAEFGLRWELVAEQETDDKVGNGHTLVYRQIPESVEEKPKKPARKWKK
jgi:hypothetical protein